MGGMGGGNPNGCGDTQANATPLTVMDQNPAACLLSKPDADEGWFSFDAKKGEQIGVFTAAKTGMDPFDPTFLDLVVTLTDDKGTQIAQNDDPNPRFSNDSEILTVIPKDGKYFLKVEECNKAFGAMNCAPADAITTFDYTVQIFDISTMAPAVTGETEPNDTPKDMVATVKYPAGQMAGQYGFAILDGSFKDGTDVDVYSFTVPSDIAVPMGQRGIANFAPQQAGTDHNGSTGPIGKIWITDATGTTTIASMDASLGMTPQELQPPLAFGTKYLVWVQRAAGAAGTNDFYFTKHYGSGSNPLEVADATNGTVAGAEKLTISTNSYFVEGDINTAGDVDFFSVDVPAGLMMNTVSVACGGQRSGSGVRGLRASVFKGTDMAAATVVATASEDAMTDLLINAKAIPAGETKLSVKIDATMAQDATVTSTFYRCGVHFQ
jgi:hypothetical protein